eukprot:RCo017439
MKDLYAILGCTVLDGPEVIKRNFRQRALKCHPDKADPADAQAHATFVELNEAYEILRNDKLREQYDLEYTRSKQQQRSQDYGVSSSTFPAPAPPSPKAKRWEPFSGLSSGDAEGEEGEEDPGEDDDVEDSMGVFLDEYFQTIVQKATKEPLPTEFVLHHEEVQRRKQQMAQMWTDLFEDRRHCRGATP